MVGRGCRFVFASHINKLKSHTHNATPQRRQLDARAHNIDLAAQKEAALKKEWDEFQRFASQVRF